MTFEKRFFVLSPNFHGATLFSKLLNAHPEAVSLGDTYPPIAFDAGCGCGNKVSQCPFWQDVKRRLGDSFSAETPHWVPYFPGKPERRAAGLGPKDHLLDFRTNAVIRKRIAPEELLRFREAYERFLAAIAPRSSARGRVFIDGTIRTSRHHLSRWQRGLVRLAAGG